ncbi:ISAzo13 family transposase, partial [Arthrobacter sp. H5]|uniref:ISAzo13 family transposase n=1 Tax=Arthrobacter sp. H5 TaxID=1267973 RepID=UPI0005651432
MPISAEVVESLRAKFDTMLPHLDERSARLLLAAEARSLGHGGIAAVARASGAARSRVQQGVAELEAGTKPLGRVRRAGAGRKTVTDKDPGLVPELVEPTRRGDPESALSWTTLSTGKLATELTERGHPVASDTVAKLLKDNGFSLQANAKTLEGGQHPDRDGQFSYLNNQATGHLDAGQPVISVDTKKKELVGQYKNNG